MFLPVLLPVQIEEMWAGLLARVMLARCCVRDQSELRGWVERVLALPGEQLMVKLASEAAVQS